MSPFNLTCDGLSGYWEPFRCTRRACFSHFYWRCPQPRGRNCNTRGTQRDAHRYCTNLIEIWYPACSLSARLEVFATFWSQSGAPGSAKPEAAAHLSSLHCKFLLDNMCVFTCFHSTFIKYMFSLSSNLALKTKTFHIKAGTRRDTESMFKASGISPSNSSLCCFWRFCWHA